MRQRLLVTFLVAGLVTSMPSAAHASFPGRNGKIAFARDGNIEVMRPDGSRERVLPLGRGNVIEPSWSPSGSRLLFTCRPPKEDSEICVARADGSRRRVLTDNEVFDQQPSWSPDGDSVLFTRGEGPFAVAGANLIVLDLATKAERTLLYRPEGINHPRWSPTSDEIVYAATGSMGERDIFTTPSDGSGTETNLTNSPETETYPSWSPDGALIVFDRSTDTSDSIFTMGSDGSDQTIIIRSGFLAAFSPNGRRIAYGDLVNGYDAVFTSRATGGDRQRLTGPGDPAGGRGSFSPDWQPR